jgi:hypothetical protein
MRAPLRAGAIVVLCGLAWLASPIAALAAPSLPPVTLPPVTAPPVAVPPATVPQVTVPQVTVPTNPKIAPVATTPPVNVDRAPAVVATVPQSTAPAGRPLATKPATTLPATTLPAARPVTEHRFGRAVASSARELSVPVVLALLVGAFLVMSPSSARADAKLAASPVSAEDELVGFS